MQQLFKTQNKDYSSIKSLIIKNITINHGSFPINIYHLYGSAVKLFKY